MEAVGDLISDIDYLLPLPPNAHLHDKITNSATCPNFKFATKHGTTKL